MIVERLKIAAQEAHRVNQVPAAQGQAYPVRVTLNLDDPRGVKVLGTRGPSVQHAYVVPWQDIERATNNPVVTQITNAVDLLTA